jgi:hypothetical protein
MFALIILGLIYSIFAIELRYHQTENHEYWFNKDNPVAVGNDYSWNYCDLKCLYLEHYAQNIDFVVLVLTAPLHDTFAACYVKTSDGYTLWNKVISNTFYEDYCGNDYKDWANTG